MTLIYATCCVGKKNYELTPVEEDAGEKRVRRRQGGRLAHVSEIKERRTK